MKTFTQFIAEELTSQQKQKVNGWVKKTTKNRLEFSDHIFNGQDRISIPLVHHDDPEIISTALREHLQNHGFELHDYRQGLVKDKYGRSVSIGKVLEKTKAPIELKKQFMNDKNRSSSQIKDLKVIISRNPHDIAGMSTDRGWTSCMNMDKGVNKKYLRHDIDNGTHVAYLVHSQDNDIKNPIARIALKPYEGVGDDRKILRPESRTYGTADDSFAHTVRKWSEENFPLKDGIAYTKNKNVYMDSDPYDINSGNVIFNNNHKTLMSLVNSPDREVKMLIAKHGHKEHLDKLVNDPDNVVRMNVAKRGHKEHLDKLVNDPNNYVRMNVAKHGHKEHLDKLVKDPHSGVRITVLRRGYKEHLDKLVNDPDENVRKIAIENLKDKG